MSTEGESDPGANPRLIRDRAMNAVIADLRTLSGAGESGLLVIGGHAISHRVPGFRMTPDIDFLSTLRGSPKSVKAALTNKYPERYSGTVGDTFTVLVDEQQFQVDIVAQEMLDPSFPPRAACLKLNTVPANDPGQFIASVHDLILLKLFAAPLRSSGTKRIQDLRDVHALLKAIPPDEKPSEAHVIWVAEQVKDPFFASIVDDLRAAFNIG